MLYLPKNYLKNREEFLNYEVDEFKKKLNTFIDNHQHIKQPYFVLFKQNFDKKKPDTAREAMEFCETRPPLIVGSMVFFIDNSRGACFLLWSIDHKGNICFNKEAPKKLGKAFRAANVSA